MGAVDATKSDKDKIKNLKIILGKLPKRNYHILKYLIAHLQRFNFKSNLFYFIFTINLKTYFLIICRVAEKASINKMHADNLGAVFGPSLMRSPKEEDLLSIGTQVN